MQTRVQFTGVYHKLVYLGTRHVRIIGLWVAEIRAAGRGVVVLCTHSCHTTAVKAKEWSQTQAEAELLN